jgi:hypothetical protein
MPFFAMVNDPRTERRDAFIRLKGVQVSHKMWGANSVRRDYIFLANICDLTDVVIPYHNHNS